MFQDSSNELDKKVTRKRDTVLKFDFSESIKKENEAKETYFRKVVEQTEAIIITFDLKGKLITANSSAEQNLGYGIDELEDAYLHSLLTEQHKHEFTSAILPNISKLQSYQYTLTFTTKQGKRKVWLCHSNLFTEADHEPIIIQFAQDISNRVEQEELLKVSTETFKSAFDYSGIGMALISPSGQILDANNAVCTFTGYSKIELLQKNFLDLTHPDDNHTDLNLLHKMLIKVINHYSIEKRYISKHNKMLWGLHTVSKVAHTDGSPKFFILQIVDITRKKQLTDELNRQNSELEAVKTNLVNKINQLEELNYIIAHNLRGPANNMRMLVEMLKNQHNPDDKSVFKLDMDEIVQYLDEGSSSLLGSLNTLMDVVQISMNKSIPYNDCNTLQIIDEILNQLNTVIFEHNVSIQKNIQVKNIHYPKVFLESILYNLISNAIKYHSTTQQPQITISTYISNNKITLSVKDNGIGIDLEKYGNKLFKLNQVFHTGYDSKGVGLFITKAQIESFGGSISVKSQVNVGTEFIVTL